MIKDSVFLHKSNEKKGLKIDPGNIPVTDLTPDDELFIRRAIEQDPEKGFELLYLRYYQRLCSHAVRFVTSRQIAEDIVSEVFFQFYNQKLYLEITTSYRAYLYKAVRNRGYNFIRWELERNNPIIEDHVGSLPEYQQPDMITQYEELYQDLEKAIETLPIQRRGIYLQFQFDGKSSKEIAEEWNVSTRTVEVHIYRARQAIRKIIKSKWLLLPLILVLDGIIS
jgi:RNA polymerase sigma-70 factor (family 1)